ncbi:hypothetical protein, partial [Methylorubrum extorquens]|uniref:hypothetical protein n=1 Tax=Methylorubrum extorquens TaxID=408 RepID=UPI0016499CD9
TPRKQIVVAAIDGAEAIGEQMRLGQPIITIVSGNQFGQNATLSVRFRDFNLSKNVLEIVLDERNHYSPHDNERPHREKRTPIVKRPKTPLHQSLSAGSYSQNDYGYRVISA